MNKKIITIAGIVFALIFVVILAVMMGTITNKANNANTKLVDTLEMTDNTSLDTYADGSIVKGESVISCIKNVKSVGGNLKLSIKVNTLANGSVEDKKKTYGYVDSSNTIKSYNVTDSTDVNYINPSASFRVEQQTNDNDVITGLTFTQQASN